MVAMRWRRAWESEAPAWVKERLLGSRRCWSGGAICINVGEHPPAPIMLAPPRPSATSPPRPERRAVHCRRSPVPAAPPPSLSLGAQPLSPSPAAPPSSLSPTAPPSQTERRKTEMRDEIRSRVFWSSQREKNIKKNIKLRING